MSDTITLYVTYPNDGRQLKRMIIALLKKGLAQKITRLNYAKSYTLVDNNIQKKEEKVLLITTKPEHKQALIAFITKLHPEEQPKIQEIS